MNGDRSSELRVAADFQGDLVIVAVTGELDLVTVGPWSAMLDAATGGGDRDLVLDFTAVTFADATALAVVATICEQLSDAGRRVAIRGESATVRRMLEVTGLDAALRPEQGADVPDEVLSQRFSEALRVRRSIARAVATGASTDQV